MAEPPETTEGWYVLHDFRTIDWDAWREAPQRERESALDEGTEFLRARETLADAPDGASAVFTVLGHRADLLLLHFRPTMDALDRVERAFEGTALAGFTERSDSYVSVTEVSGYVSDDYFEDPESVDAGVRRYIEEKLEPDVPPGTYVSFYPMSKRREPGANWYDLDLEERADLMADHGEIGKEYAGRIRQVISASVGFEDHEWGVTLFGDDPTDIKDIVYEMRFDEASAKYGEFGAFYVGRRFPPADLAAFMAGEAVPAEDGAPRADVDEEEAEASADARDGSAGAETGVEVEAGDGGREHAHGDSADAEHPNGGETGGRGESDGGAEDSDAIREELADLDIYAGQPRGEDVYAMILYSAADREELFAEVRDLRESFDHYDTHVKTAVYEPTAGGDGDAEGRDRTAVVSIWETASAAETAGGFLADLPDVEGRAGETEGFGTMGMFYTVKPERRADFVGKFETVGGLLGEMEGHRGTDLLANVEDENDMFIASRWDSRADAMAFFRSEDFRDTVQWGRDVLADRPRHVFLA
jgi:chlorite dismutase